jgi:hypothetical protein
MSLSGRDIKKELVLAAVLDPATCPAWLKEYARKIAPIVHNNVFILRSSGSDIEAWYVEAMRALASDLAGRPGAETVVAMAQRMHRRAIELTSDIKPKTRDEIGAGVKAGLERLCQEAEAEGGAQ